METLFVGVEELLVDEEDEETLLVEDVLELRVDEELFLDAEELELEEDELLACPDVVLDWA